MMFEDENEKDRIEPTETPVQRARNEALQKATSEYIEQRDKEIATRYPRMQMLSTLLARFQNTQLAFPVVPDDVNINRVVDELIFLLVPTEFGRKPRPIDSGKLPDEI